MKVFLCVALSAGAAFGQAILSTTADRLNLRPGESANFTIAIGGQGATPSIAALQYTGTPAGSLAVGAVQASAAAVGLGKSVVCGTTSPQICILFGVNSTVIPDGTVITGTITVAASASPGLAPYHVSNVVAAAADGSAIALGASADLVFVILNRLDLNGDGKVDLVDVNIVVQQAIGNTAVTNCDVNGDSVCDVRDVQAVSAAAH